MLTGSIIIDIEGKEITQRDIQRLSHPVVCGVILFTRNFDNKNQIQDLISSIKSVRDDLLITVDHEGGRVQRFRENFYAMPSMSKLGDSYAHDSEQGLRLARYAGWLIARELGELHIDLNYSPVLDINYGKSSVIGNRSFSDNPKAIIELAKALFERLATFLSELQYRFSKSRLLTSSLDRQLLQPCDRYHQPEPLSTSEPRPLFLIRLFVAVARFDGIVEARAPFVERFARTALPVALQL